MGLIIDGLSLVCRFLSRSLVWFQEIQLKEIKSKRQDKIGGHALEPAAYKKGSLAAAF